MPTGKRKRLQHVNGSRARQLRARVLAAYDTCARCGLPVDKTLRTPHPMSPEVGHIVPFSRGGADAWGNVQLEHRICNQRAGAKLPTAGQGRQASTALPMPTSQDW